MALKICFRKMFFFRDSFIGWEILRVIYVEDDMWQQQRVRERHQQRQWPSCARRLFKSPPWSIISFFKLSDRVMTPSYFGPLVAGSNTSSWGWRWRRWRGRWRARWRRSSLRGRGTCWARPAGSSSAFSWTCSCGSRTGEACSSWRGWSRRLADPGRAHPDDGGGAKWKKKWFKIIYFFYLLWNSTFHATQSSFGGLHKFNLNLPKKDQNSMKK